MQAVFDKQFNQNATVQAIFNFFANTNSRSSEAVVINMLGQAAVVLNSVTGSSLTLVLVLSDKFRTVENLPLKFADFDKQLNQNVTVEISF